MPFHRADSDTPSRLLDCSPQSQLSSAVYGEAATAHSQWLSALNEAGHSPAPLKNPQLVMHSRDMFIILYAMFR